MEAAGEKLAAEIEALNAEIARLTDASSASGARRDTLRAELAGLTARRTEAQVAQAAAEAAEETARQRLPDLEQAAETLAVQRDDAKQDLADTIQYRHAGTKRKAAGKHPFRGWNSSSKNRKAALDEADTAEQRLGRELDAARQRLFRCCGNWKRTWTATKTRSRLSCGRPVRPPSAGRSGAGIHHPEGGARVRGGH